MPPSAPPDALPAPAGGDLTTVWDALCFMQSPITVTRLSELLGGHSTERGTRFHGPELRALLAQLRDSGHAHHNPQGLWWAPAGQAWPRFVQLVQHSGSRQGWWQAWKQLHRFDHAWHLELFTAEALVGAVRVVVYAGGQSADFERLCRLSPQGGAEQHGVLAAALLQPFDEALWAGLDDELRYRLLMGLIKPMGGDGSAAMAPLWAWLLAQSQPDPERLHQGPRLALAEHLVLAGDVVQARRVLHGLDHPAAQALRAGASVVEGDHASATLGFEAAWKEAATLSGRRKQLFPEPTSWLYAVSLIAQADPTLWTRARKFAAGEAGKRDADPYTFWGVWQEAMDQRLGDAPRSSARFALAPPVQGRPHGLLQLSHLLLAAWLGHGAAKPMVLAGHAQALAQQFEAGGLPWLAMLARRSAALLLDQPALPADAAWAFPVAPPAEPWREALDAIVALGTVAGVVPGPAQSGGGDRLIWTVRADSLGRVRQIEPWEQKGGARGLGKPKAASLLGLSRRTDLPAHDAAVLRAVKKLPFGGKVVIDKVQAAQALVRHPHVAWHDAPLHFIEVHESLPQLEVLSKGDHLQFKVIDPIRPDAAQAELDDDDMDEDDWDRELNGRRGADAGRPPVLLLRDGPDRARLLRITPAQLRVAELVSQGWQVPTAARTELETALRVLGTHFQVSSDAEAGTEVPATAVLRAELTPQGDGLHLRLVAAPFGDHGPRLAPGLGRERATCVHQGATLSTRRLLAQERANQARLLALAEGLDGEQHAWLLDEPDLALAVVEALGQLADAIVCEWPKGKPLRVQAASAPQVQLRVKSKGDWLDLDGELTLDDGEVIRLRQLLDMVHQQRSRYVALGDGRFLALADTLRQQLADLGAVTQQQGPQQRVPVLAAIAWSQQAGAPSLDGDSPWLARCQAWETAQQARFEQPAGLLADLRDYQLAGWRWLMRLATSGFGAVLADDMGLGKTLQTLGLLTARAGSGPALVVAPTSVCGNWLAEARRFAPGLQVALYGDTQALPDDNDERDSPAELADSPRLQARRQQVLAMGPGQVLVCSYGLLQADAALLTGRPWHTVVLDEAQAIKNAGTARARAAQALQADFKLALTGTPIENRLSELWSIMAFANPGLLGSAEQFNQRFATPIEREGDVQVGKRLRRLVSPFLLRRTKAEVLDDLPPRTEIVLDVVPGSRERALLEALRQQAEDDVAAAMAAQGGAPGAGAGQAQMHVLAALTRLRRAACDPRLVAPEAGIVGAKVQAFEQLAQELVAGRHKALVFSQFTDFLGLLRERLDAAGLRYQYLDGSTPAAQRTQRVAAFQAGEGDLFLISLKAGGFGLNLTMADYVIITDPWWNPAAEDQASGRAHRMGQQRPVTVYRLVTQGSVEDRIVRLHHNKRALAEDVIGGQDGASAPLAAADLLALLQGETPSEAPATD